MADCNLNDYRYNAMVDQYIKDDSPVVFGNFTASHASHIITRFLETAQISVAVLSGNFADAFYDGLAIEFLLEQTARRLSNNNGHIRIITTSGSCSNRLVGLCDRINAALPARNNDPVIQYIPARYSGKNPLKHFMVVDAKRYRLEEPHSSKGNQIPDYVKAEVCCNGRKKASELLESFDAIWCVLAPSSKTQAASKNV